MFFGMCNSPGTFQQIMNEVFGDFIEEGFIVIYMDDLLIITKDLDRKAHMKIVRRVLQRLRENDLFVKQLKCRFYQESVDFLGMIVSEAGVSMDPEKVSSLKDYEPPKDVKGV